ncbi:hypothetical protein [Myxosarcina sp. GI1(2024)]
MSEENTENNGNQIPENQGQSPENGEKKQALALSVKEKSTLLPQNRPIERSHLQIVDTYSSVGSNRPIAKGTVEFKNALAISGNRPIAVSKLHISQNYSVMGNRPVAPNEMDDVSTLMGYID